MVDETLITQCYRSLDRVVSLCQHPQLSLKNSPPYILDTIPDLYEKIQSILRCYQPHLETLNQTDYFPIFVRSLIDRCQITIRLFRDAKDKIFEPASTARSRLVKLSLIFSHLLKDLNALFPENLFDLVNYRITKYDAAKWWSTTFQGQSIVSWDLFFLRLCQTFHSVQTKHAFQLKQTIDLTCNDHVSIFEFDVFTRLFQPWSNIIETWEALTIYHPGYMSFMTYDEVKVILKKYRSSPGPGTYVFRISCTKPGQWAIGYITEDLRILQTIIQNKSLAQALLDGELEGFYLFPNGKPSPRRLLYQLVHNQSLIHLQVTQEQYQTYCEVGSTFELCKICDENNKDIQLEPCRHLICRNCLLNCQLTGNGQTCPFCRLEIKGTEEVIVDPYKPLVPVASSPCPLSEAPSRETESQCVKLSCPSEDNLSGISSSLCRQISLPDAKSRLGEHDLNATGRSLSLDMALPLCSQDLIDLVSSDDPNKIPPPVPPRHLSGSPGVVAGFMNSTVSGPVLNGPSMHLASSRNLHNLGCSSSCLLERLIPPDTDCCQCPKVALSSAAHEGSLPNLPPSTLNQSTSSFQPDLDSLNRKPDLHYAELDLIDSDMEPETEGIHLSEHNHPHHPLTVARTSSSINTNHQNAESTQNSLLQPPDLAINHYDQLSQQTGQRDCGLCNVSTSVPTMIPTTTCTNIISSDSLSIPSFPRTPDYFPHLNPLDELANQLILVHPDMSRSNALLLLRLTENRLDMSHRIWEHFQPRTNYP